MMSFQEFKEVRTSKVAGPSSSVSPTPSMTSSIKEVLHMKMSNIFTFIDDAYQDLRRFNSNLQNNLKGTQLMQTINKYKNGCNEIYSKALDSYDMSHKLAQNIVRTIDIFKELCSCMSDLEEYNYRMCEIMSIFIVCELRLSVDATPQEQLLIAHRIIYIMRRHLVQEEEQETLYNILRTLVYIPKLFNARDIMCAIFGEFIPIKPVLEVKILPDKLYILYIIVFYRWMMMQKENDDKILIVNFAQSFMKPSVSLCSNNLYGSYLPMYATHSTATRTILNNLKFYRDIRNASVIDNAFKNIGAVVNLCDDDEEDDIIIEDNSPTCDFAKIFDSARLEALSGTISNIKFEEKTVVSTVDLTEEEEPTDQTSIDKRHEIWLNEFQMLAQQYRESQLVLERQQNFQMISNGEKEAIICLDSDSEEETEISTYNNDMPAGATANQQNISEDLLFVDNYPLTDTPINCDSGLDENDVTKLSPRFLSSTLRTYQAKKCTQSETEDKNSSDATELNKVQHMDKAYRRNSVHISSTPPESTHNEDDDGTDVQDEHDDDENEETNTYLLAPNKKTQKEIPAKEIRPMGPYPTYNNINNEKGVFSHSDSSEITKSPKKQKQKVRSYNCKPRKHSSHTHRYKASDALECSHLQETIKEKYSNVITYIEKRHNMGSNFYKNVPVFNQKSLRKLKVNLKKLRLGNDISLTNFKSNSISKQQPHTTPHTLIKHILNNKNNSSNSNSSNTETEPRQLKTNLLQNDDDLIFKKPLPVTKKFVKFLKIENVVSLRKHSYDFKETPKRSVEAINDLKISTDATELEKTLLNSDKQQSSVGIENKFATSDSDTNVDHLSKISRALTEKINILTNETGVESKIKVTNKSHYEHEYFKEGTEDIQNNSILTTTFFNNNMKRKSNKDVEEIQAKKRKSITIENIDERSKEFFNLVENDIMIASSEQDQTFNKLNEINLKENYEVPTAITTTISEFSKCNNKNNKENNLILNNEHRPLQNAGEVFVSNEVLKAKEIKTITELHTNSVDNNDPKENESNNISINDINCIDGSEECENREHSISIIEELPTSILERDNAKEILNNTAEITQNSAELITNFSAEFLASLSNKVPSSSKNNTVENASGDKSDIDFEFENTPTMCLIDLDVMSETTSDMPATMPLPDLLSVKENEADKLLEDFNNKTEDIVESALSKKTQDPQVKVSHYDINCLEGSTKSSNSSKVLPININNFNQKDNANTETVKITPKSLRVNDEEDKKDKSKKIGDETVEISKKSKSVLVLDCNKHMETTKQNKPLSEVTKPHKTEYCTNEEVTIEPIFENKLKKVQKESKTVEIVQTLSPPEGDTQEIVKPKNNKFRCNIEESNEVITCTKTEPNTRNEIIPHQMEASINENQEMTVELGNWKSELQDENKTNDSEIGGEGAVSAIFSFPKIPIISISIHTTRSNKTYFKISNRENDDQTKEDGNTKKIDSPQTDNEGKYHDEKRNTNKVTEIKIKEKLMQQPFDEYTDNVDEEIERDEEEDEENGEEKEEGEKDDEEKGVKKPEDEESSDNFEIEKFSHDSNSACSLPLKKRPTQVGPNGDTEEVVSGNYEQLLDIAAEVIIENTSKDKTSIVDANLMTTLEHDKKQNADETGHEINAVNTSTENSYAESCIPLNDIDDNKPSTSAACTQKLCDPALSFKRRIHIPIGPTGHTPIQIVAPQLKDNSISPSQDHRSTDVQLSTSSMLAQTIQPQLESYPATPMLSVANVEKLMDFNRFIEDLLASPNVMTIIDNANVCGYYAESQAYEMERVAILEHYNITNAKGNNSTTKRLYWKKSASNTISIFNENDNEWISLPSSTAKQLQKLSFVLSILQQQYKVNDVRQRINIALTFLIRNTSKYKNISNSNLLQQRLPLYFRNISDISSSNHTASQVLPSKPYYRLATSNEALTSHYQYDINPNSESVHDLRSTNYANNHSEQPEPATNSSHNWDNIMQFSSNAATEKNNSVNIECEQQQQNTPSQDKRNSYSDEINNDQLYINPPCATSPQNEVIVNTNGVQLHEMPQDQQNIFISITDEAAGSANGNTELNLYKYNLRQQQQQNQQQHSEVALTSSSSSLAKGLVDNGTSLISSNFMRNTFITKLGGSQGINLQNPYRMQQQQHQTIQSQILNKAHCSNILQRNLSPQNLPINIYNNNNYSSSVKQQQQQSHQRIGTRITSALNSHEIPANSRQDQTKSNESNYKEILQPYITYLIKDHEKTSKHLLQVFEEVSNSISPDEPLQNNLNRKLSPDHQQFCSLLPTLIRNPEQNHMPGLHQIPGLGNSTNNVLSSFTRTPHQNILVSRDSGALQVVQSFLEQSQTSFDTSQQQQSILTADQQTKHHVDHHQKQTTSLPGFAKEYVNFVAQKQKLEKEVMPQRLDSQRLSTVKRKSEERNNKLTQNLKRKMKEFSLLKHNIEVKLLEQNQKLQLEQKQQVEIKQIEKSPLSIKCRRGRPRKINKSLLGNNNGAAISSNGSNNNSCCASSSSFLSNINKHQSTRTTRLTSRKQTNSNVPTTITTSTDHAYFRQRSAAREAAKRINAAANGEHIAEASTLFRKIIDKERLTQASSSASSVSSRTTCKNSRLRTSKKTASKQRRKTMDKRIDLSNSLESITKNGEEPFFIKTSDVYHSGGALLSCDDAKLQKRCAVVITASQEVVRFEREMYNKILLEQRKNLELRTLEKQREKELERERKKRDYFEKSMENTTISIKPNKPKIEARNDNIIFKNMETGYDSNFQMRIRKPKQENTKVVQPLNIQVKMTETTTLLSKIDAHLHTPATEISIQQAEEVTGQSKQQKENQDTNDIIQHICDINNEKVQTKLGELDLLADIAQNLSPYQLDNNPPSNPSPATELSPLPPALEIQRNKKEMPKEKITVTEHLIIQSVDNLLEKTKPHLNNYDQEHQASINYAHEPKLKNVTTIFKSSLNTNLLQNQNQLKNNDNPLTNNLDGKGTNSEIQINKTNELEQILEESINVLKPVNNSKFNIINECSSIRAQTHSDSKSGILISNVESLNHFEQNDTVQLEKSDGKCTIKSNSKNELLIENALHDKEEMYEKTKDQTFEQNRNLHNTKSVGLLPTTIINKVESIMMPKIFSENDLSNICLESEISTHSSEIAEPSPVVTDMSDNSNESEHFKDLDTPFTQTPTVSNIIPLKFGPQSESQSNSTPLKNSLEPEADYNVTKFLDFILNKTVTDDESETRDKIIKELNVLTVDTGMLDTPNASKKDVLLPVQCELSEQQEDIISAVFTEERKTQLEKTISEENANIFKGETNNIGENCKLQQTLEYSSQSHIEYKSNPTDNLINEETKTSSNPKEQNVSQTACTNNNNDELNPPIENQENKKDVIVTAKNSNVVPPSPGSKINQSINTKCVVRLKRINATKKETWMAIPPNTKRNISKCDIVMKTNKKLKLESEQSTAISKLHTVATEQLQIQATPTSTASTAVALSSSLATKPRTKPFKTVTFDLKNSRPPKKLPENTLRAAETLQLLVNNINDSVCTAPPREFNKKRSSIKNKCIAEDETPRPPPASALMGTLPCKKTCTEKARSQATPPISSITNDISTARIYTSSPLDQTLPEYDDNVDTVADSELILPAGSLRRKLKRPKKSLTRDVNNQSDCNGEDDTDAVVDNEDDVFAEEILPIPAANEHILEDIVSARPPHISAGTVIRDNYMSIEETPTVPAYLFNDESHDSPCTDPSETRNVVDSSSSSSTIPNNVTATNPPSTTSVNKGNLEKSMLSPSEHEVSSTQETFYQTPTKNKQQADEKSSASNDNGNSSSGYMTGGSSKQKLDDINKFQNKEDYQSTSTNFLLQNNQVDTTNHSPEMCTLTSMAPTVSRTPTANITTNITNNRKIHKTSTHDEILFSELQQQFPTVTPFLPESTSDNINKTKIQSKNLDGKLNGEIFSKTEEKVKFSKSTCKRDIIATKPIKANLTKFASAAFNNSEGGGGSSPSTTTIINEDINERPSKIILKASEFTPSQLHPANPLKITIPISLLNRSRSSSLESPNSKLFMGKNKETTIATAILASQTTKKKKEQLKTNTSTNTTSSNSTNTSSSSKTASRNSKNADLTFPPDKYDLIKSKEKHHRYYDDQEDINEKSKDKTNSQSKTLTSNNSRSHKNSTKDKVKGKKSKQKHKLDDGIKKVTISQSRNKASSSSLSLTPITALSKTNNKQNNNKSSKNTSGYSTMASSSSPLSSSPAILKDVNLSNAPVLIASTQITTAALSTNNVRKKLKIK